MLMNYHGMTMNERRDSPARRKQFLVICSIMMVCFIYAVLSAGVFSSLFIKEGIFPGGEFVYKYTTRDYAASMALSSSIADDLKNPSSKDDDEQHYNNNNNRLLYSLYLDDPYKVRNGRKQRFACGILVDRKNRSKKRTLMKLNQKEEENNLEQHEWSVEKLFPLLPYQSTSLPSVDAAMVQHPYTNGFVSALVTSYKIIPALRNYATQHGEKGNVPVVTTTCSVREQTCTHYAPLVKGKKFLLGQPDMDTYMESFQQNDKSMAIDWSKALKGLKRMIPPLQYILPK